MDLDAVSSAIRSCRACGLGKDNPLPVPPRFHRVDGQTDDVTQSRDVLLVIGEAPGRTEAVKNTPMVGPSGRLAASWLERLVRVRHEALRDRLRQEGANPVDMVRTLVREQAPTIVIANTVQCWPDRTPTMEEVRACRRNVFTISSAVSPTRVLLFGGVALSSFVGLRIGEMAGRWLRLPYTGSDGTVKYVDAMSTWHPAATLRNVDLQENVRSNIDFMGRTWWNPYPSPSCPMCGGRDAGVDNWWKVVGEGEGAGGLAHEPSSLDACVNFCDRHHALQVKKDTEKGTRVKKATRTSRKKKATENVAVQEGLF